VPAWRGVLERGRLLARRGDEGALVGVIGHDAEGALVLIDETSGRGALGVRVAPPAGVALADGDRIVAWGGFEADGARWRFTARRIGRLAPSVAPAPAVVPREARPAGEAPEGARLPTAMAPAIERGLRRTAKEATLIAVVLAAPERHGDGWLIGDDPAGPPTGMLLLPGEASIYGGLDYLADDERWRLATRRRYAVAIAVPSRVRRSDGLPVFEALEAPTEVSRGSDAAPSSDPRGP
jgi:hypothetical protein